MDKNLTKLIGETMLTGLYVLHTFSPLKIVWLRYRRMAKYCILPGPSAEAEWIHGPGFV